MGRTADKPLGQYDSKSNYYSGYIYNKYSYYYYYCHAALKSRNRRPFDFNRLSNGLNTSSQLCKSKDHLIVEYAVCANAFGEDDPSPWRRPELQCSTSSSAAAYLSELSAKKHHRLAIWPTYGVFDKQINKIASNSLGEPQIYNFW